MKWLIKMAEQLAHTRSQHFHDQACLAQPNEYRGLSRRIWLRHSAYLLSQQAARR